MSYQHHWVVVYDEDWGAFMVDAETTNVMLEEGDGTIYNKTTGHWEFAEEGSEELAEYQRLEEILAYNLTRLDLTKKVQQDTDMITLPKELHLSRTISYDVQNIAENILDMDMERDPNSVTLQEIVDFIKDWVYEDFGTMQNFTVRMENEDGEYIGDIND